MDRRHEKVEVYKIALDSFFPLVIINIIRYICIESLVG